MVADVSCLYFIGFYEIITFYGYKCMINKVLDNVQKIAVNIRLAHKLNSLMAELVKANTTVGLDDFFKAVIIRRNKDYARKYSRVDYKNRAVILPACLSIKDKCKSLVKQSYRICGNCGGCVVNEITINAQKLGYKAVAIAETPGSAERFIKETTPGAVLLIACAREVQRLFSAEKCAVPMQFIRLKTEKCGLPDYKESSMVDLQEVMDIMEFKDLG